MRFEFSAIFWLLLSASASSFGTPSLSSSSRSVRPSFVASKTNLQPLVPRGGASCSKSTSLSASVDTAPEVSAANLELLSARGKQAVHNLIEHDVDSAQRHVYGDWPEPGTQDDEKKRLAEQVRHEIFNLFLEILGFL
jgi:hypothetical protein